MADQHEISVALCRRLSACGADVEHARAAVCPPGSPAGGGSIFVDTETYFAFWDAIDEHAPVDLGLQLATKYTVLEYDLAHLAALHSQDVRSSLEKFARYKRLCGPKELVMEPVGRTLRVHVRWLPTRRTTPPRLVDGGLAALLLLLQRGTGTALAPVRVELVRTRGERPLLERFFGCEIRFGAQHDALVLADEQLDLPYVAHNADLLALIVPGLESKLSPRAGTTFADLVREAIARRMAGERPSVQKVARELAVSTRTLQRRLGELGTSYQQVLDEARREAAVRLLRGSELQIPEIAFLLGFEELNSFTRAFRSWEGATPRRWRDSMKLRRGRIGESAPVAASSGA